MLRPFCYARTTALAWVSLLWFTLPSLVGAQTSPDRFLGFTLGADRQLADYEQITAYFRQLDQESPRLKLVEIGQTTLKKPMIMAVITSERNMERLDRYKDIVRQLRDARGLSPQAASELAREGKVMIALGCNIHSTEIASSQMAMELAYKLVTGRTPFDAARVLEDVIVLLIPSVNPDGQQMVTEWYKKYLGTPYEGGRMPWLYHHYAGHDNNRDFYMFNLPETRAVGGVLYRDWLPQIFIDEHQMGSTGARFYISPYQDPYLPDVHPLVWRSIALMGANMMYDLDKAGMKGVVSGENYTGWWTGGEDEVSWPHNIVAFLTEGASAKIATPIYIEPNELAPRFRQARMNFPNPWPGGWWRMRDLIDYELVFNFSAIRTAFARKEDFLYNFYVMNKDGIEKNISGTPYAYVIPRDQHDPLTMLKMVDVLLLNGLEMHRADEPFRAGAASYPAGSYVVLMAQPYRPQAETLLGPQKYPDLRQHEGGPPIRPYDNAAWTLPMLMGVAIDPIDQPFTAKLTRLTTVSYPTGVMPTTRSPYLALDPSLNASYAVAFGLLAATSEVYRVNAPLERAGIKLPAGAFIIKNDAAAQKSLPGLIAKWHTTPAALDGIQGIDVTRIRQPRIGLYQSYQSNMDEGWIRYVFEDLGVPYLTLRNKDMREAAGSGLKSRIDVLVLASESPDVIVSGGPPAGSPAAARFTPLPPEYAGGIGKEGVEAIKAFVEAGGVLVALNEACRLAFRELQVPVGDAVQGLETTKFFLPSSIVKIKADPNSPVGFGMPSENAAMFANSIVMDTWMPSAADSDRRVVARFPEDDVLMSGWLIGEERIAGKAAVVDVQRGRGRIILIGVRVPYRAQAHGTYKLLLNSLLYPRAAEPTTSSGNDQARARSRRSARTSAVAVKR